MDDKIAAISTALTDAFSEVSLEYQFTDDLHKFRVNLPEMTHWLYVSPETIGCSSETDLLSGTFSRKRHHVLRHRHRNFVRGR